MLGRDLVIGDECYLGDGGADIMNGQGGDDIMVGSSGPGDRYKGGSGFDWATFKDDPFGVTIDMNLEAFDATPIPASPAAIAPRFSSTEGLSGSTFSDYLIGDDIDATTIATSGVNGSVLTNIALIDGLQEFLGAGVTSFDAGNIILGGNGSDIIEGRGGNDLIDGDRWLNVRISVRANPDGTGPEIASYDSMIPLIPLMMDGTYNPGQLQIVREILPGDGAQLRHRQLLRQPGGLHDHDRRQRDGRPARRHRDGPAQRPERRRRRRGRASASTGPTGSPASSGCSSPIRPSSWCPDSTPSRPAN